MNPHVQQQAVEASFDVDGFERGGGAAVEGFNADAGVFCWCVHGGIRRCVIGGMLGAGWKNSRGRAAGRVLFRQPFRNDCHDFADKRAHLLRREAAFIR